MAGCIIHLMAGFPQRLARLRKERGLSQKELAQAIGVHYTQLRRYEAGTSQPTLDVLRALATTLRISADVLLFDETERAGLDDELKPHLEALSNLDQEERKVAKDVLEALLLKHEAKRWAS
ncbi:MAG: helix-turn-helix transcriptional regulator [Myxococcota bacterium]|nr:helix-turn-helix transcriptional regulator [Myxococcota bacterium]